MMVMLAGQSSGFVHYLAGKHPGKIGWLLGPSCWMTPRFYIPYAMDNDAFSAWTKHTAWDVKPWSAMLAKAKTSGQRPLWLIVPDVVADRKATIENWHRYAPECRAFGWPLAFAVQDGMTPGDVPSDADVVFVGGTTGWKWRSLPTWAREFKRVHLGRVNTLRRLWTCQDFGVESVDGTGWFRATSGGAQAKQLVHWLSGERSETMKLGFDYESLADKLKGGQ